MFLPIGDENPRESTPYVNYAILGANVVAFLLFCLGEAQLTGTIAAGYALVPSQLDWGNPRTWGPLFTSMFLHGGFLHLAGNMLFLWICGDNVEDKLGHFPYLLFYLACGVAADALHILSDARSAIPMIGASGAISGVLAAYVVFFPRHRIKILFFFFLITVFYVPAWLWIGFWFLQQILMAAATSKEMGGGVAYLAHIGGFLAGIVVGFFVKFIFAPNRFGVSFEARRTPAEFGATRARPAPQRRYFRPIVPGTDVTDVPVARSGSSQYAVVRMTDDLQTIGRIAAATSAVTGEKAQEVARRLNASRGVIAKGLDAIASEKVYLALRRVGIPTLRVRYEPGAMPPTPISLDRLSWDEQNLFLMFQDERQPIPWSTPFLYLGAVVTREPLVDIYIEGGHVFRVSSTTQMKVIDSLARTESRAMLRDLAQGILLNQESATVNDGIRVLAHRGTWGWLNFARPEDFDDYAFWMYALITADQPTQRIHD